MMQFPVPNPMHEFPALPQRQDIWRPHVTVACVVTQAERFLMVEEDIHGTRYINQPAGHLEPSETLPQAALRETLEETGWEVMLDHFIGVQQWHSPVHGHQVVRFAFAGSPLRHHPERKLDTGIVRALWMPYADIIDPQTRLRSPLVLTTLVDWLAGQRLPLSVLRSLLPEQEA